MDKLNNIPGTVVVDGSLYAVSLLWSKAENSSEISSELKKSMMLIGSKLYIEPDKKESLQFAVADKSLGHKRGMVSLASTIHHEGRSFCALLPSDKDVWVLLAADKDGNVIFDKAFYGREEAKNYFNNYVLFYNEWDIIYCPEDIGSGISIELGELITSRGKRIKEKGISTLLPVVGIAAGVIVFAGSLFHIVNWWLNSKEKEIVIEPQIIVQERLESIKAPWSNRSEPLSLIANCRSLIEEKRLLAYSVPGWIPEDKATCKDGEINFIVQKGDGLPLWMDNAAEFFLTEDKPKISMESSDKYIFSWNLKTDKYPEKNLSKKDIAYLSDAVNFLKKEFENSFIDIKLSEPKPSGLRDDISKIDFSFSLKQGPFFMMPVLEKINGLVLTKLEYDFKNGVWEIEGIFWGGR